MAQVRHAFNSAKADDPDTSLVNPSNWNADHIGIKLVRKTANEVVTSSVTLQNDDHLLFAVAANEVWMFDLFFIVDGPSAGDLKVAFTAPAGATVDWGLPSALATAATVQTDDVVGQGLDVSGEGIMGLLGIGTKLALMIHGIIVVVGTAGNLQFQWAQNVSDAGATTTYANSWIKALRLA